MGITQLINNFYEKVPSFNRNPAQMCIGQIAWVPTTFVEHIPYIMEVERASAIDHESVKFHIKQMNNDHFKYNTKLPIKGLQLKETEECLIQRAKKRPCILIARNCNLTPPPGNVLNTGSRKHILHDTAIFLPLYGIEDANRSGGFPQVLVDRIKVLMYEQFFFFKQGTIPITTTDFVIDNSIGRLDRMFISSLHHPSVAPTDGKITDEVINLLMASLARFIKIPLADADQKNFESVIDLIKDSLPVKP